MKTTKIKKFTKNSIVGKLCCVNVNSMFLWSIGRKSFSCFEKGDIILCVKIVGSNVYFLWDKELWGAQTSVFNCNISIVEDCDHL